MINLINGYNTFVFIRNNNKVPKHIELIDLQDKTKTYIEFSTVSEKTENKYIVSFDFSVNKETEYEFNILDEAEEVLANGLARTEYYKNKDSAYITKKETISYERY